VVVGESNPVSTQEVSDDLSCYGVRSRSKRIKLERNELHVEYKSAKSSDLGGLDRVVSLPEVAEMRTAYSNRPNKPNKKRALSI
jgi:hypothetical protein